MGRVIRIRSLTGEDHLVTKHDGRVAVTPCLIPTPPTMGAIVYDAGAAQMNVWDGKRWVTMQSTNRLPLSPAVQSDTVLYGFRVYIDNDMRDNEVVFDSNVQGFVMNGLSLMKVQKWRHSMVPSVVDQELLDNLNEAVRAMKRDTRKQHYAQRMRKP